MRKNRITMILGGARSGKSEAAVSLAMKHWKKVTYVATASAGDEEMKERIEKHKKDRPCSWNTIEAETGIGTKIAAGITSARLRQDGMILDCLTMLVSNIICRYGEQTPEQELTGFVFDEIDGFLDVCREKSVSCIIVSNETGMGIVPAVKLGRVYRDVLGKANKYIAAKADKVLFMIAGLAVDVKKISR